MTRKHFKMIAEVLSDLRPTDMKKTIRFDHWSECVRRMADMCSESNPRFIRTKFYAACGRYDT